MDNSDLFFLPRTEHEEFAKRLEEQKERSDKRLQLLEDRLAGLTDLTIEVKSLAQSVRSMAESISAQNARINEIEQRDGNTWRTVRNYVLTFLVGALLSFVLAKIGISS